MGAVTRAVGTLRRRLRGRPSARERFGARENGRERGEPPPDPELPDQLDGAVPAWQAPA